MGGLGLVLISLHLALILIGVVVHDLVSLAECVVEGHTSPVVSVTAEVWFWALLFLDFHGDDLNLIIRKANFNFELVWHDELVSLNRVIIVLLLLLLLLLVVVLLINRLLLLVVVIHVLLHLLLGGVHVLLLHWGLLDLLLLLLGHLLLLDLLLILSTVIDLLILLRLLLHFLLWLLLLVCHYST